MTNEEIRKHNRRITKIINRIKRDSPLTVFCGRRMKSWRVPGTREAGSCEMWVRQYKVEVNS